MVNFKCKFDTLWSSLKWECFVVVFVLIFGKRVLMRNCLDEVGLWTCLWKRVFIALPEVWELPIVRKTIPAALVLDMCREGRGGRSICKHTSVYFLCVLTMDVTSCLTSLQWWTMIWNCELNKLSLLSCLLLRYFYNSNRNKAEFLGTQLLLGRHHWQSI